MDVVYKKARAKINLTLNVNDKREDGYHNIESVFQKISLYDELYIKRGNLTSGICIKSNVKELENADNIICKAYHLLKEEFYGISSVCVDLKKNIPMQAGLGGGSSDCAKFIEGMNKLFGLGLTEEKMRIIGARLGADVPAAFYDMPIIARGIGERIEKISSNFRFYLVLIKPAFSCDTKAMYDKLDNTSDIVQHYNSDCVKCAIQNNDIESIARNLYNVFENSVDKIDEIKRHLIDKGALNALMTGSGSCVYGIFKDKQKAKSAYKDLKKIYESYFCVTM